MEPLSYPVAFGHWQLARDQLLCRLPHKTVSVAAPGALLRRVLALCDGRFRWNEVAAAMAKEWDARAVQELLERFHREGLLVEAGEVLARWASLSAAGGSSRPLTTEEELALQRRAEARLLPGAGAAPSAPPPAAQSLVDILRGRVTHRTFADRPLAAEDLHAILWAAHGVTRESSHGSIGWHRTIASGGAMHSTRWFVFVLRALGGQCAPGLHEARFHQQGGVTLQPMGSSVDEAWRCIADPRVLQFASALVLPVHEVSTPAAKYGDRAALFAHVEVGQSLQNAQLMASALAAGATVRGDVRHEDVLRVLGPALANSDAACGRWLALPAVVLGAAAAQEQQRQQQESARMRIGRPPGASGDHAWFAGPVQVGGQVHYAGGRGPEPRLALRKAEAEAWERQGWAQAGATRQGTSQDFPSAVDPTELVAYSAAQYATAGFPFRPFSRRRSYTWCQAIEVTTGAVVHVPADCVHALSALPATGRRRPLTSATTSGVAAGTDEQTALCRATLELLERDAFLQHWLAQRAPCRLASAALPAAAAARVARLRAQGFTVEALTLTEVPVPVVSVFVQSSEPPFTTITAAADFEPDAALHKAIDEAEGHVARAALAPPSDLRSCAEVRGIPDVARFYRSTRFFRQADFFASGKVRRTFPRSGACSHWQELTSWCADQCCPVIAVDITPAGACVDQGRTPLKVVRAFLPGLLPLWFGYGLQPAGLPRFAEFAALAPPTRRRSRTRFIHPFT